MFVCLIHPSIVLRTTTHSFRAVQAGPAVTLRWQTASEANVVGFDVYRLARGHKVKVNHRTNRGVEPVEHVLDARV